MIGIEENQPILNAVLGWMETFHIPEYQEETGKGLVRNIMIRCGFSTGQIMVVIVANADRLPHEGGKSTGWRSFVIRESHRRSGFGVGSIRSGTHYHRDYPEHQ